MSERGNLRSDAANFAGFSTPNKFGSATNAPSKIDKVESFITKRLRTNWAKMSFMILGIAGLAIIASGFILNSDLFQLTKHTKSMLSKSEIMVIGFWLGLIFALFISGQLIGEKKTNP